MLSERVRLMMKNLIRNDAAVGRWTGRIVGALLVSVIVIIAAGQGIPNVFEQPVRVQIGFLALGLMAGGILGGWLWELWGGIISLFGWCLFVGMVMPSPRAMNGFVLALALPGALYLMSALLRRLHPKLPAHEQSGV